MSYVKDQFFEVSLFIYFLFYFLLPSCWIVSYTKECSESSVQFVLMSDDWIGVDQARKTNCVINWFQFQAMWYQLNLWGGKEGWNLSSTAWPIIWSTIPINEILIKTLNTKLERASLVGNTLCILLYIDMWGRWQILTLKERILEALSLGSSATLICVSFLWLVLIWIISAVIKL